MAEKVYKDPDVGDVIIRKDSRCRRVTLRVHPFKGVRISVPSYVSYDFALQFFLTKKDWVIGTLESQRKKIPESVPQMDANELAGYIESLRLKAKIVLIPKTAYLAQKYGFKIQKVTIKHNKSNWGSCSTRGNINLNLSLVLVPSLLQDYVILHELAHLKHQNHGEMFHALVEKMCQDRFFELLSEGDELAEKLLPEIKKTHAAYPVEHVLEKSIKNYRPV